MTKVDIFSGFLGAGKTTLIKKLISEAYKDEKLVLIENEFGDIGVDGEFLKDSGIQVNEMNSGCICCSLVGDFGKALDEVVQRYKPDRILIEPSGVGKLSDVILAVQNLHNDELSLNGFTTVVDAKKCKMYMKNFGEFFNNQVENASAVILSHTDGLSQEKLDDCIALIREHNSGAEIVTTKWEELDGKLILQTMEKRAGIDAELENLKAELKEHHHHHDRDEESRHEHDEHCGCGHHHDHDGHGHGHEHCDCEHHHDHEHEHDEHCGCGHHHHHADEIFRSVGIETSHKFSEPEIRAFLNKLGNFAELGTVLRAKGVVESTDEGWLHFDYVPGEADVRTGSAATTGMICVIGVDIEETNIKEALAL